MEEEMPSSHSQERTAQSQHCGKKCLFSFPYVGFSSVKIPWTKRQRDTELPSPSAASPKDQNALLKACSSTIHPSLLFRNSVLSQSISLATICVFTYSCLHSINLLGKYHSKCTRVRFCVDVYRLCQQESVDSNEGQSYPAEIFQQGLYFQRTNNSRETNLKHNDAITPLESFQSPWACTLDAAPTPMRMCQCRDASRLGGRWQLREFELCFWSYGKERL